MNEVRNLIISVFLIVIPKIGLCGDFASWWQNTPNQNVICNEKFNDKYAIGIYCKNLGFEDEINGHVVSKLIKWYFYRGQIIGEYQSEHSNAFFIFDELTCQKQSFNSKIEFDKQIQELKLKPKIWTRWYKSNWGIIFADGDLVEGIVFMLVKIPILIIISLVFLISMIRTKFSLGSNFNRVTLGIMILICGRILLDFFPQSF